MNTREKRLGTRAQIRAIKNRERRIATAIFLAFILLIVAFSAYFIYTLLNPSPYRSFIEPTLQFKPENSNSQIKAAIVDHLSLTVPNQTFVQAAAHVLTEANYTVDYYSGKKVTVELYRSLPTLGYDVILLRVHSAGTSAWGEAELQLFTSEPYSKTRYVPEQLAGHVGMVKYSADAKEAYFGICPNFVQQSMKDKFKGAIIIVMGCDGLEGTQMAKAFIENGAKAYISWSGDVIASHTDQATTRLLQHLITEKQTIKQAVENTMKEVGPDPTHNSILSYYPFVAGEQTIENTLTISGYLYDETPFKRTATIRIIWLMPRCGKFFMFPT